MTRSTRSARALFAAIALSLAGIACGANAQTVRTSASPPTDHAGHGAEGSSVVMRLIAYKPDALTVAPGTTVRWNQQDAGFHTVTSGTVSKDPSGSVDTMPDGGFASGRLEKGDEFTFAFDEEGTYAYFCEIHPATMSGRVTVE